MKTLYALFAILALTSVGYAGTTSDGYALRFSSIRLPKDATIAFIEFKIQNGGAVIVRDLPPGWCTATESKENGDSKTMLAVYGYKFERIVVPKPVPLKDLDHSVLVQVRYPADKELTPKRSITVTGYVLYALPGDKIVGRNYDFTDAEITKVYGNE